MERRGVRIVDTFAEAFDMRAARVVITAVSPAWARIAGQSGWTFVARLNRASYEDPRPLVQPGVPEIREYMAQGVIGDQPVGLPSDPKIVVFAGQLAA